jgi:hypothetical protein
LLLGELGDLVSGVHGVVAAIVHEIADIVGPKDLDDSVKVLGLVRLELVAAGADGPGSGGHARRAISSVLCAERSRRSSFSTPSMP